MILKIERLDTGTVQLAEVPGVSLMTNGDVLALHVTSGDDSYDTVHDAMSQPPRWCLPASDQVAIYLMNDQGKTVDRLWPKEQAYHIEVDDETAGRLVRQAEKSPSGVVHVREVVGVPVLEPSTSDPIVENGHVSCERT